MDAGRECGKQLVHAGGIKRGCIDGEICERWSILDFKSSLKYLDNEDGSLLGNVRIHVVVKSVFHEVFVV